MLVMRSVCFGLWHPQRARRVFLPGVFCVQAGNSKEYRGYVFTAFKPEQTGRGPRALLWKVTRAEGSEGQPISLTFKYESDQDAALDAIIDRIESSLHRG